MFFCDLGTAGTIYTCECTLVCAFNNYGGLRIRVGVGNQLSAAGLDLLNGVVKQLGNRSST